MDDNKLTQGTQDTTPPPPSGGGGWGRGASTFLKLLLLFAVAAAIIYTVVVLLTAPKEVKLCSGIDIDIEDSLSTGLINERQVRDMLRQKHLKIEGQPIDSIHNSDIIRLLSASPYIDTALCYHTPAGRLCIDVVARQPVLHVMPDRGPQYYIDRRGRTMPVDGFNVDLNIATGVITKRFAARTLVPLAVYIRDDAFFQPLVQQIHVVSPRHIQLILRLGDAPVDIGDATDLDVRMPKLQLFLTEGLRQAGWNKYDLIDASYRGIVVAHLAEGRTKGPGVLPVAPKPQPRPDTTRVDTVRDTLKQAPQAPQGGMY